MNSPIIKEISKFFIDIVNERIDERKFEDVNKVPILWFPMHNLQNCTLIETDFSKKLEIDKIQNEIRWNFKNDDNLLSISSEDIKGACDASTVFKTKHEIIIEEYFNLNADMRFDSIFKHLSDGYDHLTPDLIMEFNDFILIIEVATVGGALDIMIKESYDKKLRKYYDACNRRSKATDKRIMFLPLIISYNKICFPVDLSQHIVNDLVFLFRLGRYIENTAQVEFGLDEKLRNPDDEFLVKEFIKILKTQDNIDVNDQSGYDFDEETYNYYKNFQYSPQIIESNFKTVGEINRNKYTKSLEESKSLLNKEIEDHRRKILKKDTITNKMKAICQMPLFIPVKSPGCNPSLKLPGVNEYDQRVNGVLRLWQYCMTSAQQKPELFIENTLLLHKNSYLDDDEEIARNIELSKETRRKWHRITVKNLPEDVKKEISLDGLYGKRYKNETANKLKRLETKKTYHPDTNVDDIERFLKGGISYCNLNELLPVNRSMLSLLSLANDMANNQEFGIEIIKKLCDTDLYVALIVIQAIATELCISIKQNVGDNEYIYKKIRGLDIELLIHPTRSDSPIFFTIRFKSDKIIDSSVFRDVFEHNGYYYTNILSSTKSKLDNLIKAPAIWLNSKIHWFIRSSTTPKYSELYQTILLDQESNYLSKLSLLYALEDKFQTEEMATGLRYISMQLLKGNDKSSPPQPHLAIKKLPTLIRSRLGAYTYNKIINYTKIQMDSLPICDFELQRNSDVDDESDNWMSLYNPYTGSPIKKCRILIDLFYIAYSKNKNEKPENNTDYQMIKKILTHVLNEDQKKKKDGIYSGKKKLNLKHGETPKNHEFCVDSMGHACEIAQNKFSLKYGKNYKKSMERYIIVECLRKINFESLATMKASALLKNIPDKFDYEILNLLQNIDKEEDFVLLNSNEESEESEAEEKRKRKYRSKVLKIPLYTLSHTMQELKEAKKDIDKKPRKQCKCIESVVEEIKSGIHKTIFPFFELDVIIKDLKSRFSGVCCYLFKKNQHGGLREIYVLTFRSRICQIFVETISRFLCSEFQEETMTHSGSKLSELTQHQKNVTEAAFKVGGKAMSRQSAEDKSKWNQNNNVNAYAFILTKLLSDDLGKMCFKILSLWRSKKILIPEGVLNLLIKGITLPGEEELESLREQFWNGGGVLISERLSVFMNSPTGMWQGILHYTSSLQHVLQTIHYKTMLKCVYYPILMRIGCTHVEVTTLVSSDDSMTKISVVIPNDMEIEKAEVVDDIISSMLHSEDGHSSFFNMIESDKSCLASTTVGEFNSLFIVANGLYSPLIKSVYASLSIADTESLITRQENYYNLLKDIYENGGGHFQTHLHQLVQAIFHYSSMGLFPNFLFPEWSSQLHICPDPSLGFFILDNSFVCGLLGYNFSIYNTLYNTNVPLIMSYPKLLKSDERYDLRNSVLLLHGNRQHWKRLADSVNVDNWREQLSKEPVILYRQKTKNLKEVHLRISAKVNTKGVFESLTQSGTAINIYAASVYCISNPSFTIKSYDLQEHEQVRSKRSLLNLQKNAIKIMENKDSVNYKNMTQNIKSIMFPNHLFFDLIIERLNKIHLNGVFVNVKPYKQKKNKIITRDIVVDNPIPLISVLRKIWYNMWVPYGTSLIQSSWDKYRDTYTWLDESPDKSLENSPFVDHVEMYNFVSGLISKRSKSYPLCRLIRSNTPLGQILETVKYNHFPGIIIEQDKTTLRNDIISDDPIKNEISLVKSLRHLLSYLLVYPISVRSKTIVLERIISQMPLISSKLLHKLPESMIPTFAFMLLMQRDDLDSVLKALISRRLGIIPIFLKEQKRNKDGKYFSYGKLLFVLKKLYVIVHIYDNSIIKLETSDITQLRLNWSLVSSKLNEMGIKILLSKEQRKCDFKIIRKNIKKDSVLIDFMIDTEGKLTHVNKQMRKTLINYIPIGGFHDDPIKLLKSINYSNYCLDYEIKYDRITVFIFNKINDSKIKLYNIFPSRKLNFDENLDLFWPKPFINDPEMEQLKNWLYFEVGNTSNITKRIRYLYTHKNVLTEEEKHEMNWFRVGLINKLIQKSKLQSRTIEASQLAATKQELIDTIDKELVAELFDTNFGAHLKTFVRLADEQVFQPNNTSEGNSSSSTFSDVQFIDDTDDESDFDWSEDVERSYTQRIQPNENVASTSKMLTSVEHEVGKLESLLETPIVKHFINLEDGLHTEKKNYKTSGYNIIDYIDTENDESTLDIRTHLSDRMSDLTTMSKIELFGDGKLNDYFIGHPFFDNYVEICDRNGLWDIINNQRACPGILSMDVEINCWICNLPLPPTSSILTPLFSDEN